MGLENTFGKVEKLPEEKKLETISSVDSIVDELLVSWEQTKHVGIRHWTEGRKYFYSCIKFLESFELKPEIITEFNTKTKNATERIAFGLYLTALIQTSYNQGHNNFIFDNVNTDCFGCFLKGQPKNPIKIRTKELKGFHSVEHAYGCSVEITNYQGIGFGSFMKSCTIKSGNKETLETLKSQVYRRENNKFELTK